MLDEDQRLGNESTSMESDHRVTKQELLAHLNENMTSTNLDEASLDGESFLQVYNHAQFRCQQCPEAFWDYKKLEEHQRSHRPVPIKEEKPASGVHAVMKCETCLKVFQDKKKFKRHLRIHREKIYPCDVCNKKFTYPFIAEKHKKSVHTTEKPFACDMCSAQFSVKFLLQTHRRQKHTETDRFKCDECGRGFPFRAALTTHKRIQHEGFRYTCDVCPKSYKLKNQYLEHVRTHDPDYVEKPVTCDLCQKAFKNHRYFSRHMSERHTQDGARHICDICGKIVTSLQSLKEHKLIHTGERPFACRVCDKAFNKKSNLVVHERTHRNERPYSCNVCQKKFTQPSPLKIHMRSHTGEKPYVCTICQKGFRSRTLLNLHGKHTHGLMRFKNGEENATS